MAKMELPARASTELANLDFLRAYAVLAVYFGHLLQTFGITQVVSRVTIWDMAHTGVLIFFVHTSLVLMMSMERLHIEGPRLFGVFYIRRAFRIYPLSIVAVLVSLVASIPPSPTKQYSWPGWETVLSNLGLMQNLTGSPSLPGVLWSLPFEVQMYIVLPILFVLLRRFRSAWAPICLWVLDVAFIVLLLLLGYRHIPALLQYTPCFLGGLVGYRLWSKRRLGLPFFLWPVAITFCIVLRTLADATEIKGADMLSAWVACLFLGLAVPQFRELGNVYIRRAAGAIAKYSYGIYLSHCIVFWIAFILLNSVPLWIQAGTCVVLSVLLPVVMYHGIEKPMIGMGVRIAGALGAKGHTTVIRRIETAEVEIGRSEPSAGLVPAIDMQPARRPNDSLPK